jgi:tape measure domain-containing protein
MNENMKAAARQFAEAFAKGPLRPEELATLKKQYGPEVVAVVIDEALTRGVEPLRCLALR